MSAHLMRGSRDLSASFSLKLWGEHVQVVALAGQRRAQILPWALHKERQNACKVFSTAVETSTRNMDQSETSLRRQHLNTTNENIYVMGQEQVWPALPRNWTIQRHAFKNIRLCMPALPRNWKINVIGRKKCGLLYLGNGN